MIVTRNWLKEWIDINKISTDELCKTLNSIGLEVDSVTSYKMPEKCVIGYVTSREKHPNADKLSVCQVDVGEENPLQIVCGAPNVDKGQYVAISLVGAVLPNGLKIKKANLRDVESNGMICSSTELGLPKVNDGIMILNSIMKNYKIGTPLSEVEELNDDVIEIELTANRGDCLSVHGVARDLSAALNLKIKTLTSKEDDSSQIGIGRVLNLIVEGKINSSLEYKVFEISDIDESLCMLVELRLGFIGIDAKNKIDKILAYAIHTTGVILRAYNKDIFEKNSDEKINVVVKKDTNNLDAIFSKDVLSYIGISQKEEAKATDKTKTVIIEASYAETEYIVSHGARSVKGADENLYRSLRGSEPELSLGFKYLENILSETSKVGVLTGSQRYIQEKELKKVSVNFDNIFSIIGKKIDKNEIIDILNSLGFKTVFNIEQNEIWIDIPNFRHDIVNIQDICEEIVRIVGIDNIPSKPLKFSEKNRINPAMINFQKRKFYRYKAVSAGFYECVHYIFDDRKRVESYGFTCIDENKDIANPITTELNTLRVNLSLNLLESLVKNLNTNQKSVCLFEVGRVFNEKREESTNIAFVASGFIEEPSILNHGKPEGFNFFNFAQKIKQIVGEFEIKKAQPKETLFSPFEYGEIFIHGEFAGVIGRVNIENSYGLEKAYICELNFEKLFYETQIAVPYSKLPGVSRDLSLLVSKGVSFDEIRECIKSCNINELTNFYATDIYSDESLQDNTSLTISLNFQPFEKSFSDKEISEMVEKILKTLKEKLNITIR